MSMNIYTNMNRDMRDRDMMYTNINVCRNMCRDMNRNIKRDMYRNRNVNRNKNIDEVKKE